MHSQSFSCRSGMHAFQCYLQQVSINRTHACSAYFFLFMATIAETQLIRFPPIESIYSDLFAAARDTRINFWAGCRYFQHLNIDRMLKITLAIFSSFFAIYIHTYQARRALPLFFFCLLPSSVFANCTVLWSELITLDNFQCAFLEMLL